MPTSVHSCIRRVIKCIPVCLILCSCSPRIVEHLVVQRDTTYITNHTRDSIYVRDSVYLKEYVKGDTVYQIKYRDRWREKIKEVYDTLYISKMDSVYVDRIVEKKVPRKLNVWQQISMLLGRLGLLALLVALALRFIKLKLK